MIFPSSHIQLCWCVCLSSCCDAMGYNILLSLSVCSLLPKRDWNLIKYKEGGGENWNRKVGGGYRWFLCIKPVLPQVSLGRMGNSPPLFYCHGHQAAACRLCTVYSALYCCSHLSSSLVQRCNLTCSGIAKLSRSSFSDTPSMPEVLLLQFNIRSEVWL